MTPQTIAGDARKVIVRNGEIQCARSLREPFSYPRHLHLAMEVLLIVEGSAVLETPNGSALLESGDLALLWPDEPHWGHALGVSGASFISLMAPRTIFEGAGLLIPDGFVGSLESRLLRQALDEAFRGELFGAYAGTELLRASQMLLALIANRLRPGAASREGWQATVSSLLRDSPEAPVSSDELAARFGLNPHYLATAFKARFGLSPRALEVARKVERARDAMIGAASLADIAVACGFSDQAHLSRCFRQVYGVSPAVFRKRNRCVLDSDRHADDL